MTVIFSGYIFLQTIHLLWRDKPVCFFWCFYVILSGYHLFFKLQNTESLPKLLLSLSPVKKESSSSLYDIFYITLGKLSSYNYAPLKSSCQIFPCSLCPLFHLFILLFFSFQISIYTLIDSVLVKPIPSFSVDHHLPHVVHCAGYGQKFWRMSGFQTFYPLSFSMSLSNLLTLCKIPNLPLNTVQNLYFISLYIPSWHELKLMKSSSTLYGGVCNRW